MTRLLLIPLAALSLTACDQLGVGGSAPTTDTNMRSVEIQVGTASDEMIILDTASGDGTAVDNSPAIGPAAPRPAAEEEDDDAAEGSAGADSADAPAAGGDQVIRPPAGGAEPDGAPPPAEK